MLYHLLATCAACAGDIRNARDRCEPIGGSRTVRRRAALSGSRTSEPADSVEKKSFPDVKKLIGSVRPLALRVRNAPRQLLEPQGCAWSAQSRAFCAPLRPPGKPSGPEHHRRGSELYYRSEAAALAAVHVGRPKQGSWAMDIASRPWLN